MRALPFEGYMDRFAGQTAMIVGKGPTLYDYDELREFSGPCIFINDAVSLATKHDGANFFFALDRCQSAWFPELGDTTAILPSDRTFIEGDDDPILEADFSGTLYRTKSPNREAFLALTREQLAKAAILYTHSGTIHPAIHFVWFLGCTRILFVGCEGFNDAKHLRKYADALTGYDERLAIKSNSKPWWNYGMIRAEQDRLCTHFNIEGHYVGTPVIPLENRFQKDEPVIPKLAHFIWLGSPPPPTVLDNVTRFQELHPNWSVRLWRDLPENLPDEMRTVCKEAPLLCMVSDILRIWLLHQFGGVYLDCDVFALRSFEELRHFDHFVAYEKGTPVVTNSVVGASQRSDFVARLLERLQRLLGRDPNALIRTAFGPRLYSQLVRENPERTNVFPTHYFAPFHNHATACEAISAEQQNPGHVFANFTSLFIDGVRPYAVHAYGIQLGADDSKAGSSSHARNIQGIHSEKEA